MSDQTNDPSVPPPPTSDSTRPMPAPIPSAPTDLTSVRDSLLARLAASGVRAGDVVQSSGAAEDRRPPVHMTPPEWLTLPYTVTLSNGRKHATTTVRRIAELVMRNGGQEGKVWSRGMTVDLRAACGFVGLNPEESMELQNLLGSLAGVSVACGDDESLMAEAADVLKRECEALVPEMRKAAEKFAAKAQLWTPDKGRRGE